MKGWKRNREAMFYRSQGGETGVQCLLCPHYCRFQEGEVGKCKVRTREGNKLLTLNYGEVVSYALDPIEKKPLYHFYPGRNIFSLGTVGCNLSCVYCQNWRIAQSFSYLDTVTVTPQGILEALENKTSPSDRLGVAYTYNEPFIWYEFVYDTARLVRERGLKNILVTNGLVNREPLEKILPFIDAMNIDVKSFDPGFYRDYCGGSLKPVKETVEIAARHCHVEITNLVIPTLNDSPVEIREMVGWLAGISPDIPLHFSRYFPSHQLGLYPTPLETLEKAGEIAREKLAYVYLGNVTGNPAAHTYCPGCHRLLLERTGYQARVLEIENNKCRGCGREINLVTD